MELRKWGQRARARMKEMRTVLVAVALKVELFNVVIKTLLSTFCFRIFYAKKKNFCYSKKHQTQLRKKLQTKLNLPTNSPQARKKEPKN